MRFPVEVSGEEVDSVVVHYWTCGLVCRSHCDFSVLCSNFSRMLRIILGDTYAKRDNRCLFEMGLFLEKLACGKSLPFCWITMASLGYR